MTNIYIFTETFSSKTSNGGVENYLRNLYSSFPEKQFVEYFSLEDPSGEKENNKYKNVSYHNIAGDINRNIENYSAMDSTLLSELSFLKKRKSNLNFKNYLEKNIFSQNDNILILAALFNRKFNNLSNETILFHCDLLTMLLINPLILKNNNCYFVDHGMYTKHSLNLTSLNQSIEEKKIKRVFDLFCHKRFRKDILNKYEKESYHEYNIKSLAGLVNLITFTEKDKKLWENYFDFKSTTLIKLPFNNLSITKKESLKSFDDRKYDLAYLGRYSQWQKNMRLLNEIVDKSRAKKVVFAGFEFILSPGEKFVKSKKINNIGRFDGSKDEFFENVKYSILTSKYEGFPFSAIESMANGVPVICLDNFPSAKFIIGENNERGFLAKGPSEMIKAINKLILNEEIWHNKSINCLKWTKEIEEENEFYSRWNEII